jgi:hypothetical protein
LVAAASRERPPPSFSRPASSPRADRADVEVFAKLEIRSRRKLANALLESDSQLASA